MVRRSTWLFLGIFIILLTALLIYQKVSEDKTEENPVVDIDEMISLEPVQTLLEIPPDVFVTGLQIKGLEETLVEIRRASEDEKWLLVEPTGDADQEEINRVIDQLTSLEIEETLEEDIDLSLLGLDEPSNTLQIQISNGDELTLFIGNSTWAYGSTA